MRVNIYSQELLLNADGTHGGLEHGFTPTDTGVGYSFVRLFLHSSDRLHHPPADDTLMQLANGGQRRAS